jgi:SAM-dependent methyltransferase
MSRASIRQEIREEHVPAKPGQWTPATIGLFWENYGARTDLRSEYFTYQVGNGIVGFLAFAGRLTPEMVALDYGCGPGFLIEKLLARKVRCHGVENSPNAVEVVNQKFADNPNWMGALEVRDPPAPFPDESFDLVTCLETLEHLLDDRLPVVIQEIRRLLKPRGVALFTTPNNEDLLRSHVYCPFCETSFHRVQHVRSFTESSMKDLLASHGFRTLFCRGINFDAFQRRPSLRQWRDLSLSEIGRWIQSRTNTMLDRIAPRPFPNGRDFNSRLSQGSHHLCALVERL